MPDVVLNEAVLDEKLTALEGARAWSPRVVSRLETLIRTADDYDLFRLNPVRYAKDRGMAENEAIDLFLYAAKVGLFEMEWHLLCVSCGHVVESFREITHLHTHFVCHNCQAVMDVSLDDFIEVSFTISPQVRDIAYRHPETLSVEDYYLKYHLSRNIMPLPDGRQTRDVMMQFSKMLKYLAPGERATAEFDLIPSVVQVKDRSRYVQITFVPGDSESPATQHVPIILEDGKLRVENQVLFVFDGEAGAFHRQSLQTGVLLRGKVVIDIENRMDTPSPIWITNPTLDMVGHIVEFEPFLSGKRLLTTQTFRTLFRTETVQSSEGIGVKDITFLFTDLKGSTAMYDQIGDAKAYYLVRQHFDTLGSVITRNHGAVVKTIGDAVMATFMTPRDAVQAAVEMLEDIEAFNGRISQPLILKIGIHRGHSIVVTLNDRLDYFGQTVNIAARVQGLADANEIFVSEDAYDEPGMTGIAARYTVTPLDVEVKGVSGKLHVHKIAARA